MLRTLVFLAGLCAASASELTDFASPPQAPVGADRSNWQDDDRLAQCAIHGAEAVDNMLDGAVYIMAAIVRCDGQGTDQIRCAVDVSSAISSVNQMVNVILKAVQYCGGFQTENQKCGLAVGVLTRAASELSAASAGIVAKCPNDANGGHPLQHVGIPSQTNGFNVGLGECIINIKDSMKAVFHAIARIMTLKTNCVDPDSLECAHNSLKIVAAITGMAQYISGSVAYCSHNPKQALNAVCAQQSVRLFHAVDNVGRAADAVDMHCHLTPAQRLYLESGAKALSASTSSGSLTMVLTALLPITAIIAFIGGSRLAKAWDSPRTLSTDTESLVELSANE